MRQALAFAVGIMLVLHSPIARASVLADPSLIPDGEYQVVVEKVVDAKHLLVKMDNGLEAKIPAAATITFGSAATGAARIFVYKGTIITYRRA